MRLSLILAAAFPLAAKASNIVMSNDDGWAEINIRVFFNSLMAAGENVVLSAPAENQSGTGSSDATPTTLTQPCEFNSCPAGSPPYGNNASNPRLNYVNSYPVTSMKYGINTLSKQYFNGRPDFAVSGPNVGSNLGLAAFFSGTVGAAVYAAQNGTPSIAFSGSTGSQTAWNAAVPLYSQIYADLATNLTQTLLASGPPYLPSNVWLNINFPDVTDSSCNDPRNFKFVLSRIFPAIPFITKDVETCGSTQLPWENIVVGTSGCYVSVSVGDASDKTDSTAANQAVVLSKLQSLLTCLP